MNVFISPFNNPFINLALEDYFLRGGAELPVAFFYINRPCVVLGRFQNPWLECHLPYLVQKDIWLVRRQSGGGCVFHDEGNLNFSFITPDGMIDRNKHALLLQKAFAAASITLQISPRNDLWLADSHGEWKKISGSAYKQTKSASFHHGTFLVSSDLLKLEESLKHTIIPKNSKSIASVRSRVISLNEMYPETTISDVLKIVTNYLEAIPQEIDGGYLSVFEVQESFNRLRSWEWLWGETPGFDLEGREESLHVHKGLMPQHEKMAFNLENTKNLINSDEAQRLFPDFSQQTSGSSLVF